MSAAMLQDNRDGAFSGLVAMAAFARRREHVESASSVTMDKMARGLVALLPLSSAKKDRRGGQGVGCHTTGHGHTAVHWGAATWHNFWSVRTDEEALWSAAVAAARVALRWRTPWHAALLRAGAADALLALVVANDSNASAAPLDLATPRRRRHLERYCGATGAEVGCPHVLLPEEALPLDLVRGGEGEEKEGEREEEAGEKPAGEKLRRAAWDALALLAVSYGAPPCGGDLEAGGAAGNGRLSKEIARGVHLMHIVTCKSVTAIFRPRGPALDGESYTLKEEVSILSALVALVSCPHSGLSACSRRNLALALGREKQQWECILSQAVWSDRHLSQFDPRLKARLLLATAAATLPHGRRWMLDHGVVWWLLEEIKKRMNGERGSSTQSPHDPSSSSSTSNGVILENLRRVGEEENDDDKEKNPREIDPDLWPGDDEVLFFAVRAVGELLVGDSRAHGRPEGLGALSSLPKKGGRGGATAGDSNELPEAVMRRSLATTLEDLATRENDWAPGVRTWATYALSGLGVFGVPSLLGADLAAARQVSSPESADVTLLTSAPGEAPARILAHRSVLLARCPALMSSVAQQGGPNPSAPLCSVERRMSSRIAARSCSGMIEYVYMGVVRVDDATGGDMAMLARRCGLHELAALLQGRRPVWGEIRHECDLRHMLDDATKYCSDFILKLPEAGQFPTAEAGRADCAELGSHIHAHSFVLGARSEYYRGLLNFSRPSERGMYEANLPNLQARAAGALVSYLYSGSLTFRAPADPCFCAALLAAKDRSCDAMSAARPPPPSARSRNAAAAIELIGACEYYMLSRLRGLCEDYVARHLAAPSTPVDDVVMLAKEAEHWALADIVAKAVERLGTAYLDLRDRGLLDTLPAWISEAIRRSHVKRTQDT